MPERIQRQRTRGYRLPPRTKCISRPSIWGNPYTVERWGREQAIAMYADALQDSFSPTPWKDLSDADFEEFYRLRRLFWQPFDKMGRSPREHAIYDFEGIDYVACWCATGDPCHGDPLIQLIEEARRDHTAQRLRADVPGRGHASGSEADVALLVHPQP